MRNIARPSGISRRRTSIISTRPKKIQASIAESAAAALEVNRLPVADPKVREAMDKQIENWKATVARLEKDPKTPQDGMGAILERAKAATEGRELSNHRLEHYRLSSGLL